MLYSTPDALYEGAAAQQEEALRLIAAQQRYFSLQQCCDARDSRTGTIRPVALHTVLDALRQVTPTRDRLADILFFANDSLLRIMEFPRSCIRRVTEKTPIQKVTRLSTAGVAWLNRQPGNTKRQKLESCKQGIPTEQRRFSLDTAENRLVKKFVVESYRLLSLKEEIAAGTLTEGEDILLQAMYRWLKEDDVNAIRHDQGYSVNNAVLGDADYNRVWRACRRLDELEEATEHDSRHLQEIETNQAFWRIAALLTERFGVDFPQQPCYWDDTKLMLTTSEGNGNQLIGFHADQFLRLSYQHHDGKQDSILLKVLGCAPLYFSTKQQMPQQWEQKIAQLLQPLNPRGKILSSPRAHIVNFCDPQPWFAYRDKSLKTGLLPFSTLLQNFQYENEDGVQDALFMPLLQNRSAWFRLDFSWFNVISLLNPDVDDKHKEVYAEYLLESIKKRLHPEEDFVYLIPDDADELSLRRLHAVVNRFYPKALPLPKCVARVLGYAADKRTSRIRSGTLILVIDTVGNTVNITPITTEPAEEQCLVSNGLIWVRHPVHTVTLPNSPPATEPTGPYSLIEQEAADYLAELQGTPVLSNAIKHPLVQAKIKDLLDGPPFAGLKDVRYIDRADAERAAIGADIYRTFEQQNHHKEDAVIWKYHLPTLEAEFEDSNYRVETLTLVNPKFTIDPRKRHIPIPISEKFTLAAGLDSYSFPLRMGNGLNAAKYEMYLHSSLFPLTQSEICRLELTYTYGAEEPFELYFMSETQGWKVKAEWRKAHISDAIGDAPQALPLQNLPKDTLNYIQKLMLWLREITQPSSYQHTHPEYHYVKQIAPLELPNGDAILQFLDSSEARYTILKSNLTKRIQMENLPMPDIGEMLWVRSDSYDRIHKSYFIREFYTYHRLINQLRKKSGVVSQLWAQGRCIGNGVPDYLANEIRKMDAAVQQSFNHLEEADTSPMLKKQWLVFWLMLGKDAPASAVDYLKSIMSNNKWLPSLLRCVGKRETPWQNEIWERFMEAFVRNSESKVAPTLFTHLSHALWREPQAPEFLTPLELKQIVGKLNACTQQQPVYFRSQEGSEYLNPIFSSGMEVMLALLRLRDSTNEQLRNKVSLSSPLVCKMYAIFQLMLQKLKQKDALSDFRSRWDINLPEKMQGTIEVHPLIYMLRCYLTGKETPAGITIQETVDEKMDD